MFCADEMCSILIAKEKTICCMYMFRIILFASGFEAYPLLMLVTQKALLVYRIYLFLVQRLLNVDIAMTIAMSSQRLISMMAGFKSAHKIYTNFARFFEKFLINP